LHELGDWSDLGFVLHAHSALLSCALAGSWTNKRLFTAKKRWNASALSVLKSIRASLVWMELKGEMMIL